MALEWEDFCGDGVVLESYAGDFTLTLNQSFMPGAWHLSIAWETTSPLPVHTAEEAQVEAERRLREAWHELGRALGMPGAPVEAAGAAVGARPLSLTLLPHCRLEGSADGETWQTLAVGDGRSVEVPAGPARLRVVSPAGSVAWEWADLFTEALGTFDGEGGEQGQGAVRGRKERSR